MAQSGSVCGRAIDRVAISAMEAGVADVEAALDVDDVSASMRCCPSQVALVIGTDIHVPSPRRS